MKRTGEIVLSIIGSVLGLIGLLIVGAANSAMKLEEVRLVFIEDFNEQMAEQGMAGQLDATEFLDMFDTFIPYILTATIIALITGVVAAILFKGNKKPLLASIILLVGGLVVLVASFGSGLFAAIVFIAAGIMGLIRKGPKKSLELDQASDESPFQNT